MIVFAGIAGKGICQGNKPWLANVDLDLRVVSPLKESSPSTAYKLTADDRISITVVFSRPVDISTVIAGKTLMLTFPNNYNPNVSLAWSNKNKTLTIVTAQTRKQLFSTVPGSYFTLLLRGNKQVLHLRNEPVLVIKSVEGHVLDGVGDGHEGSDFIMQFAAKL